MGRSGGGIQLARIYGGALSAQILVASVGIVLHLGLARSFGLSAYADYVISMALTMGTASIVNGALFEPYLVLGQKSTDGTDFYRAWVATISLLLFVAISFAALILMLLLLPRTGHWWEYGAASVGIGSYCSVMMYAAREAAIASRYGGYVLAYALATIGALVSVTATWFTSPVFAGWTVYAFASIPLLARMVLEKPFLRRGSIRESLQMHIGYAKWSTASSILGVGAMQLSSGLVATLLDPFVVARYRLALIVPSVAEHVFIAVSNQLVRHTIEQHPIVKFLHSNLIRFALAAGIAYAVFAFFFLQFGELGLNLMLGREVPLFGQAVFLVLLGGYFALLGNFFNVELKARKDPQGICLAYALSSAVGISVLYAGAVLVGSWTLEISYVSSALVYSAILCIRARHRRMLS